MTSIAMKTGEKGTSGKAGGLYIADGEGQPRWIWPAASNTPDFLDLYQATTFRQRAFAAVVRLIFFLRLQRIVFPSTDLALGQYPTGPHWAVFTGTPGPNRKQVIVNGNATITKVATEAGAIANLRNEACFLQRLQAGRQKFSFSVPRLRAQTSNGFTMEKLSHRGTWSTCNDRHTAALRELRQFAPAECTVGEWAARADVRSHINSLRNTRHPEISASLVDDLFRMVVLEDMGQPITCGPAHGDFTPWNTLRLPDDRLGIIDWEMARPAMPSGYDFFHFHLQQGIMVERKSWREIHDGIRTALTPTVRAEVFGGVAASTDRYLRLYLLHHISYYLALYQRQAKWHQQVYWQLEVWSDALTAMLPASDQRKVLISRLFGQLEGKEYAVLKMTNDDPLALPAGSDFDVLLGSARMAGVLTERLLNFPHVASHKVVRKSFMTSVFLLLKDGQVLNVDLIWKLKRKATVFMEAGKMIRNARQNSYGIRVVSREDTRRYLQLFYGLNGAAVPARFGKVQAISSGFQHLPGNRGWRGLSNRLAYVLDSARTALFNRGFVLTFSGVDGAGKSTVIGHVVPMLAKQLRRPVKVLRHRPSVLPILSAYRYGKTEAEAKSVARLPRTGSNNSLPSSLARFGYYYLDYLLGQWYIHLRYVMRGYTVVYDRYYYDFMADGRRSNLELPPWITAMGFWFIKKPAFNFFLFAQPKTILARKQELDADTIVTLTRKYRTLFDQQAGRAPGGTFLSIENKDINKTLSVIRNTVLQKTS